MKKVHFTAAGPHAEVLALADDEVRFHDGDGARPPVHVPVGIKTTSRRPGYAHERALNRHLSKRISDFDLAYARRALNAVAALEAMDAGRDPEDALIELIDAEKSGALGKAILDVLEGDDEFPDEEPPRESGIIEHDVRPPDLVQKLRLGKADALFTRAQDDWLRVLIRRFIAWEDGDDPRDTMLDLFLDGEEDRENEFRLRLRHRHINQKMSPLPAGAPDADWYVKLHRRSPKLRGKAHERRRLHDYAPVVHLTPIAA